MKYQALMPYYLTMRSVRDVLRSRYILSFHSLPTPVLAPIHLSLDTFYERTENLPPYAFFKLYEWLVHLYRLLFSLFRAYSGSFIQHLLHRFSLGETAIKPISERC